MKIGIKKGIWDNKDPNTLKEYLKGIHQQGIILTAGIIATYYLDLRTMMYVFAAVKIVWHIMPLIANKYGVTKQDDKPKSTSQPPRNN